MNNLKIISAYCENFKGFKQVRINFGERITRIQGANGAGKSTIASLIMWILFGIDYDLTNNPKVRREIGGVPINDIPVIGEITLLIDGTEVMAKKVQIRSVKKDGSYADANTYSINGVEKTLRDYQAYFNFSFVDLLMCMNIGSFLSKKPTEMREFLFKLPEDISDKDIIVREPEFAELVPLVEKYSIEEIGAMNKASIAKLNKEISGYPGRIDEVNRQIVDDMDTAELELHVNALKEQIADVEKQEEDSLAQGRELDAMSKDIMDLKFKCSDIEREANAGLIEKKRKIQKRIDDAEMEFRQALNESGMLELDKQRVERNIASKTEEKDKLLDEWKRLSKASYPKYAPLLQMDESTLVCPTCGQNLPDDVKAKKLADYEENSRKHLEKYNTDKELWETDRANRMNIIAEAGKALRAEINNLEQVELPAIEQKNKDVADKKVAANAAKTKAMTELSALPGKVDLSENQEYEAICREISKKEEALKAMNTGADYRVTLKAKKAELQTELDSVKAQISRMSKNVELEERIEFLRAEQAQKEQAKADCERILDLLDNLDKKKNELLVDDINSHFGGRVTWDLFAYAKNGNYKSDYCVPRIDGFTIHDNTANKGRRIEAMMIIALSVQKIVGIQAPIIIDDGESLDPWRLPECESQLIVMNRTDDKVLNVEVA